MARLQSLGVCVREGEFSETSQVVTVFTREHGMVRGLAKGARRPGGSFDGGIELLSRGELLWVPKPAGQLATLTSWTVLGASPAIRTSWERWAGAMYLAQLFAALFQESDPHPKTFDRFVVATDAPTLEPLPELLELMWTALEDAGFRIELETDILTGEPLVLGEVLVFIPSRGGLSGSSSENAWRVRSATVQCLRDIAASRSGSIEGTRRAIRLLHAYIREILGRELSSWEAVAQIVQD